MNFAPLQPCAASEQLSLISSISTSPQEMMQWWTWAGKNSDSCVPSETHPKGGKQEAIGKGWEWGTTLQGDTYKTLNFPTTERNEGRCSLSPHHPRRLPQPPVPRTRHSFDSQAKARESEGAEAAKGHQPRTPSCPADIAQPGLQGVLH